MRTVLLTALASALIFATAAEAAAKPREAARGCVYARQQADGATCRILRGNDGVTYSLHGADLPPLDTGTVILVRGKVGRGGCPLRVVLRSVQVTSWTFTRAICPPDPLQQLKKAM